MATTPLHHFLDRGGRRLHCLDWPGGGPALVCLHNNLATADIWSDLPAALGGRYRVLAVDLPGHGESDPADPDNPPADIGAVVEALVGEPVVLVGLSAGARRAALVALRRPELVHRLILIELPVLANDFSLGKRQQRMATLPEAPSDFEELVAAYARIIPNARPELLRSYVARIHRQVDGVWRHRVAPGEPWSARGSFALADLGRLNRPVLLLHGARSRLCGPEGARQLAAAVPDLRTVEVPEAGHHVLLRAPEFCYTQVAAFVSDGEKTMVDGRRAVDEGGARPHPDPARRAGTLPPGGCGAPLPVGAGISPSPPHPLAPSPRPTVSPSPLAGLRVFDLTIAGAGPWAAMLLGLLGAEVVKVESPDGDMARGVPPHQRGMSTLYITANLNKRGAILDLKEPRQRDLAVRLAAASDVFLENFRPGTAARLGLGYETLRERNPGLVYCSLSAYGQTGPMSGLAGNDPQVQAFCGWCSVNGAAGGAPEMYRYFAFIDLISAVQAVQGILLALYARARTGAGQKVEISMLEAALSLQTTRLAEYFATGRAPERLGNACANAVPHQAFRCRDGRFIAVGVLREADWPRFCAAIERPDLAADPAFATNAGRVAARDRLVPELEAAFQRYPAAWWLLQFTRARLPVGPFLDFEALRYHPQVLENGYLREIETPWGRTHVQGPPWHFGAGPLPVHTAPVPGEHTRAIAREAGWDGEDLAGPDYRAFDHKRVGI